VGKNVKEKVILRFNTFPQIWVIALDELSSEGNACNWSDMLAHRLKE